ncbi:MAG: hypothetical protein WA139_03350 [Candidatus Aenigmatarchaeota archaeon]
MDNTQIRGDRKTKMRGRSAQPFLNNLVKGLHELEPFEDDLVHMGIDEKKIADVRIVYYSSMPPKLNSIFMFLPDKERYITVRNGKEFILKIVPQKDSEILFCESTKESKRDKVGMFIDKYRKEEIPGERKPFYYYFIAGDLRDKGKRSVDLENLTEDYATNVFASSTMKQIAQSPYAKKVGFDEFKKVYNTDNKFTAFYL